MAEVFFKLTARSHIGPEAVENIFYYHADLLLVTDPTTAQMEECAQAFQDTIGNAYVGILPTDLLWDDILVQGFKSDGSPGGALPVVHPVAVAGNLGITRDSNALAYVLNAAVGDRTVVQAGGAQIRRPYWAFGPALSAYISDTGSFTGAALAAFTTLRDLMDNEVFVIAGTHFKPCKVSHTLNHNPVPSITAFREVTGASWNPQIKTRKSRNNQR